MQNSPQGARPQKYSNRESIASESSECITRHLHGGENSKAGPQFTFAGDRSPGTALKTHPTAEPLEEVWRLRLHGCTPTNLGESEFGRENKKTCNIQLTSSGSKFMLFHWRCSHNLLLRRKKNRRNLPHVHWLSTAPHGDPQGRVRRTRAHARGHRGSMSSGG